MADERRCDPERPCGGRALRGPGVHRAGFDSGSGFPQGQVAANPGHDQQALGPPAGRRGRRCQGRPELPPAVGELEGGGHHADHFEGLVVEANRPSHDPRIGSESLAPRLVAQDDDLRARSCVRLLDEASELRRHPERAHQAPAERRSGDRGRLVAADHRARGVRPSVDRGEKIRPRLQGCDLLPVEIAQDAAAAPSRTEIDQTLRIGVRQWPKHQRVHDGVDRRRRANAKRQREAGDSRERPAPRPGAAPHTARQSAQLLMRSSDVRRSLSVRKLARTEGQAQGSRLRGSQQNLRESLVKTLPRALSLEP